MVALGAFTTPQEQAVDRAIEESMLSIRSAAIAVGMDGGTGRTVALQSPDAAQVSIDPDAATFRVIHEGFDATDPDAEQVLYETTLGVLTMSVGDRSYAFEGGAIYRNEDDATQMIAPPPFAYRGLTANLAVLELDGSGSLGGATSVHIGPGEDRSLHFPNTTATYDGSSIPLDNPVENGSVKLEIQSEHYEGWYDYFDRRGTGTVTKDDKTNTVTMELESISEVTPNTAITYQSDFHTRGNPTIEGDVERTEFLLGTTSVIDSHLETAVVENDNEQVTCVNATEGINASPCTLTAGTYYFDGDLEVPDDIEINTTGGDVELVIDGDFDLVNNEIKVTGDRNNTVTYYVAGSLEFQGGARVYTSNQEPEAYRNAFVIGDGVDDDSSGGGTVSLDAIIYASNAEVNLNGNFQLTGSLHARSVTLGGNDQIIYDESVEERVLDFTAGSTPVMFLHIAEHTVTVDVR